LAAGKWRRELLFMLTAPNADLRLTAIQMFGPVSGLSQADREEIGPALIRVALDDASLGHRQEAIYVLGNWREPMAAKFFRSVLADHPPLPAGQQHASDERYWDYRLRLVALLGLAKLGENSARDELVELHRQGGAVERMDVLLAFRALGEVPAGAWDDLNSVEPKLVATAQQLIAAHADAAAQERLRNFFRRSPLWLEFDGSGLDDHNILETAGLEGHDASH
jgi:HEAT repeat protein